MPDHSSSSRVRLADVVFDVRSGGKEASFTYLARAETQVGDFVLAPLANRALPGVAFRVYEANPDELGFPREKLKPLEGSIEGVSLPLPVIDLVEYVAKEYLCLPSSALSPAFPAGIATQLESSWILDSEAAAQPFALTALQAEILQLAREQGGRLVKGARAKWPPSYSRAIELLEAKGILRRSARVSSSPDSKASAALWKLTPDESRIEAFLAEFSAKRPAQALVLMRLRESNAEPLRREDIQALAGVTPLAVKNLIQAGLLEMDSPVAAADRPAPRLNADQAHASEAIVAAAKARSPQGFLLYGVTGSGKTEVYLRSAAEALKLGRQVLYLVPEIALSTQAIGQLRSRFGSRVAILHSELGPRDRLGNWMAIRSGHAPVVLGARSAIFAPLENLGLIVVDEEHESSYKQESSPRYHVRRLARFLAERHRCPYVLGSATPSLESFQHAQDHELEILRLPSRTAQAQLPTVQVEDLGEGFRRGEPRLLSETLQILLAETVGEGHQAILFLNRRAYSPFLICRDCGHFFTCPRCAVSLSYSRKTWRLRCHHCGHQEPPPDLCAKCQGSRLNPFGVGTEKVEEAVASLLPHARVSRLDRDVSQRKGALESILAAFGQREIDVLVGTQIVAKGLDFPNVTLVGVIAADVSLNIPDFRAAERTFQLLSQVAGRAGRGSKAGRVVIQTFNPRHPSIVAAQAHDFEAFFEPAIRERREAGYPPFRRLMNIVFSGESLAEVLSVSEAASRRLRSEVPGPEYLGPADCPIERLQGRWRKHILAKLVAETDIAKIGAAIVQVPAGKVQIVIDVDPNSLM